MCEHMRARVPSPLCVRTVVKESSQAPKPLIDKGLQTAQIGNMREDGRKRAHHDRPFAFLASSSWVWRYSRAISSLIATPM